MGPILALVAGLFAGGLMNAAADRLPPLDPEFDGPFVADRPRRLAWWEWLPLLSGVGARKARRMRIANNRLRYPVLEIATAAVFALVWAKYGSSPAQAVLACAFVAAFLTLGAIDLETRYLPFKLSIPTLAVALAVSPFWSLTGGIATDSRAWWDGLAAATGAFGFFYGLHLLGRVMGRPLMGDGDAYLAAAFAALLGAQQTLVGLYFTAVTGGLVAVAVLGARAFGYKTRVIPYGPYLVAGGMVAFFYGRAIVDWSLGRV